MKIPEYQYPLYKKSDKAVYLLLKKLEKTKKAPKIIGSQEKIDKFLKLLIASQKMKDYRKFRDIALREFKNREINLKRILERSRGLRIKRGIDWAIFKQDKRLNLFTDKFSDSKITFQGTNKEILKFVVKFLLTQLLYDWRGPLLMVLLECPKGKKIKIAKLNKLISSYKL